MAITYFVPNACVDTLLGPNGFECVLGEEEDRNWLRDDRAVVDELNRVAAERDTVRSIYQSLLAILEELLAADSASYHQARDKAEAAVAIAKQK